MNLLVKTFIWFYSVVKITAIVFKVCRVRVRPLQVFWTRRWSLDFYVLPLVCSRRKRAQRTRCFPQLRTLLWDFDFMLHRPSLSSFVASLRCWLCCLVQRLAYIFTLSLTLPLTLLVVTLVAKQYLVALSAPNLYLDPLLHLAQNRALLRLMKLKGNFSLHSVANRSWCADSGHSAICYASFRFFDQGSRTWGSAISSIAVTDSYYQSSTCQKLTTLLTHSWMLIAIDFV